MARSHALISRVVVFTASDVLRGVAEKVDIIEDGSLGAANLPGVETILADVEEPTVVRVNITSVVQLLAVGVKLGVVGAREPVSEDLFHEAAASAHPSVFPLTGS